MTAEVVLPTCGEPFPNGSRCTLDTDHEGKHSAPLAGRGSISWPRSWDRRKPSR